MMEWIQSLDIAGFRWINQQFTNPVFDLVFPWLTGVQNNDIFRWAVVPVLLVATFLAFRLRAVRWAVALACTLVVTDGVGYRIFKPTFHRLRPNLQAELNPQLRIPYGPKSGSFPSNHAMNSFAVATVCAYYFPFITLPVFAVAVLAAYSRVYVGVHFPTDVLFGALFGVLIAWLVIRLLAYVPFFKRAGE
jgi:undecaprenyl-diphosphatase